MTHLDEKALAAKAWADLEFAASATGALEVANITLPIEKVRALVNERSALPSSPVSDLVGRLRDYREPWGIHDELREVDVCLEAASTLTTLTTHNAELEREVKRLREALQAIDDLQVMEINPSNYDHENVCELNANAVQAALIANAALYRPLHLTPGRRA